MFIILILDIVLCQIRISKSHVSLDYAYRQNMKYPQNHPLMNAQLIPLMPAGHPNVDALFANPQANPLPPGHPELNSVFATSATAPNQPTSETNNSPSNGKVSISGTHVDLDQSYAQGLGYSRGHPLMQARFQAILPAGHPNIDTLMTTLPLRPLPQGHPPLNSFVTRRSLNQAENGAPGTPRVSNAPSAPGVGPLSVPYWHPSIDQFYTKGIRVPKEQ